MRIGFTGTRHGMTVQQRAKVAEIVMSGRTGTSNLEAHHGDCLGADSEFHDIARLSLGNTVVSHPPSKNEWRAYREYDEQREGIRLNPRS